MVCALQHRHAGPAEARDAHPEDDPAVTSPESDEHRHRRRRWDFRDIDSAWNQFLVVAIAAAICVGIYGLLWLIGPH